MPQNRNYKHVHLNYSIFRTILKTKRPNLYGDFSIFSQLW